MLWVPIGKQFIKKVIGKPSRFSLICLVSQNVKISASIVVYKHRYAQLAELVNAILVLPFELKLFIIDNSPQRTLEQELPSSKCIQYHFCNANLGYGKAHNIALRLAANWSEFHLVLNPDILFEPKAIVALVDYMKVKPNIGLLMPKVLYANGETQFLCKLFPTPFDLIMRRFIPGFLKSRLQLRLDQYELKHKNYDEIMEVPNLSGCFMFLRMDVLRIVGLFDESFFMYLEDTDLSRRINLQFQTIYYPKVSIIHQYEKGSYKSLKLLKYHIVSAFRYFNKYGWFFDTVRTTINGIQKS
jgi:GT2 family glycosyltransferase